MYKVEVYGFDGTSLNVDHPSSGIYYTCLQPSEQQAGTLFTMGRKRGDCQVVHDQSVSRDHLRLTLVTANKTILESSSLLTAKPAPCDRSTPEQIEACQNSKYHTALVLTSLGKFGTYRVVITQPENQVDHDHLQEKPNENDDDSATTADSQAIAASQLSQQLANTVPLSPITKKLIGNAKAKLECIEANKSIVLYPEGDTDMDHFPVILQCGKMGTTVVITKIEIRLVPSGLAKKELEAIQHSLFAINAVIDPEIPDSSSFHVALSKKSISWTYLVTPEYKAGINHLTAWCRNIPFVNVGFVHALLARTSPSSSLPDPSEFAPEPDPHSNLWQQKTPNPNLWSSCTFLSVSPKQDGQYEKLVAAAGGNVHCFYDSDGVPFSDEEAMQQTRQLQKKSACFCIGGRRKLTKMLQEEGVPIISSKEFALAIIEQRLIQNPLSGNPIGYIVSSIKPEEKGSLASLSTEVSNSELTDVDKSHTQDSARQLVKDRDKQTEAEVNADGVKARRTSRKESSMQQASDNDNFSVADTGRKDENEMEIPDISQDVRACHETATEGMPAETIALKTRKPILEKALNVRNQRNRPCPRMSATEMKQGGWIPALPKTRGKFIRSAEEIKESTGWEEVRTAAPTDIIEGLIVYNSSVTSQFAERSNCPAAHAGPNFKRFRKNSVPVPCSSYIKLRSVLPKESEYQRDVEEQRHAIEEQQRRADELFSDIPTRGRRRRI
jgi:hypothetical protein